jgi:hypothetical protein
MIAALFRWIFKSAILAVLLRLLGRFFPALRRILRIVWR